MQDEVSYEDARRQRARALGENIRAMREGLGWTQVQLAERSSTSQQTIDRLERGEVFESKSTSKVIEALGAGPNTLARLHARFEDPSADPPPQYRLQKSAAELDGELRRRQAAFISRDPSVIQLYLEDAWKAGEPTAVDAISRPFPLERVLGGYGVILSSHDLSPVYEAGDTVIVHPFLPSRPGNDVLYRSHDGEVRIRRLEQVDAQVHLVSSWRTGTPEQLSLADWPTRHVVVGRYLRT
ncbi:helix-turn-helix domain-containing protein [Brevundimonas intermedia]|uniref:helix-turn-helix domain-containing protein n=1 Tax=Brevundimonas intermedia TaxID=74315 RepID=UPI0022F2969D|nr:helix-turn-helix domain-containing protein [Brevundimonas intermedia]